MRYLLVIVGLILGFAGLMEVNKLTLGSTLLICGAVSFCLGIVASYIHEAGAETRAAVKEASIAADVCRIQAEAVQKQLAAISVVAGRAVEELKELNGAAFQQSEQTARTNQLLEWLGEIATKAKPTT